MKSFGTPLWESTPQPHRPFEEPLRFALWTEAVRYKAIGTSSREDVEGILNALQDPNDGILAWIKKRW